MSIDSTYWTALQGALAAGELSPLDYAFTHFLYEQAANTNRLALTLAALASQQLGGGHSCLDRRELPRLLAEAPLLTAVLGTAPLDEQDQSLLASGFAVAAETDDGIAPLLLSGPRLYLRRYWNHERRVAAGITERVSQTITVSDALGHELDRLFPRQGERLDWQKIACAIAVRHAFAIITGGPGTGKTRSVVRLLALLQTLQQREPGQRPLRIRLAAPTGKAAARLNTSIADQIAQLDVDESIRASIPAEVSTLHRLLGSRPDTRRFRHDRSHPLHVDVLVIDEASMVDLEMMSAVLDALPATARLILLGDKDQLASVEAGAVLGDLCLRAEAGHYNPATAHWLREIGAGDVSGRIRDDAVALDQTVVMLRDSHRFSASSGIGQLADAVNHGDLAASLAALDGRHVDLHWLADADAERIVDFAIGADSGSDAGGYASVLGCVVAGANGQPLESWAGDLLDALPAFQLLCALRAGPRGVSGLNASIAAQLRKCGLIEGGHDWYAGRPVLVTRNDYALGLMNGDVGLTLAVTDDEGHRHLRVAFRVAGERGGGPRLRLIAPSRLAHVETAYAMTVHKSQGSEFAHCALVLPDRISPALTRELLYTGITRASQRFTLIGSREVIAQAVATPTRRQSGLQA